MPESAGSGLITAMGSIGGVVGPWLQGILLLQHGFRPGLAVTLARSSGMLLISVAVRQRLQATDRTAVSER